MANTTSAFSVPSFFQRPTKYLSSLIFADLNELGQRNPSIDRVSPTRSTNETKSAPSDGRSQVTNQMAAMSTMRTARGAGAGQQLCGYFLSTQWAAVRIQRLWTRAPPHQWLPLSFTETIQGNSPAYVSMPLTIRPSRSRLRLVAPASVARRPQSTSATDNPTPPSVRCYRLGLHVPRGRIGF